MRFLMLQINLSSPPKAPAPCFSGGRGKSHWLLVLEELSSSHKIPQCSLLIACWPERAGRALVYWQDSIFQGCRKVALGNFQDQCARLSVFPDGRGKILVVLHPLGRLNAPFQGSHLGGEINKKVGKQSQNCSPDETRNKWNIHFYCIRFLLFTQVNLWKNASLETSYRLLDG